MKLVGSLKTNIPSGHHFWQWYVCCTTEPHTVKINMLYLIKKIVAIDYKQYYYLNLTN